MSAAVRISQELQAISHELDRRLQDLAGDERPAFALVIFTDAPGGGSVCNYVSNVERAKILTQLRALVDRWEADAPDVPHHKKQ